MHLVVGVLSAIAVFVATFQFIDQPFTGYLNLSSVILILGAPVAITVASFDFGTLADAIRVLRQAMSGDGAADQSRLMRDLYRFGRLLREGRVAEAARLLDTDGHPLLRDLGPLALQRADASVVEETVATVAYARTHRAKRAEEVFQALGRSSPAMGMTGTVIGMIHLLSNMDQYDKLGAGMALAMVSTLYGLVMQHGVYGPLARKIDTYGRRSAVNSRLLERGLVAIVTGRPLHDLRLLAGEAEEAEATLTLGREAA